MVYRKILERKARWIDMLRSIFLLLILGLCGMAVRSQENANSPAIYKSVDSLTFLTDTSQSHKVGIYKMGGSLGGYLIEIDSNGHFLKRDYSCLGGRVLDSGSCVMYKTGRLGLKFKTSVQTFDVVKFSHYCFLISPDQRMGFIKEFRKTEAIFKNQKTIYAEDQVFTSSDLRAAHLMNGYYARDLLDQ
jgi:hypothetical protein